MTLQEPPPFTRYKLTVADYFRLGDAGAFSDRRTELIDGEVLLMSPQHRPHMLVKGELDFRLRLALRDLKNGLYLGTEGSVELSDVNAPMPDIVIFDDPHGDGPVPVGSVRLIVEVADTTLDHDLRRKAALYGAAAVPEYWVADVRGRVLHQHWRAESGTYTERRTIPFGDPVTAATIPGLTIATTEL